MEEQLLADRCRQGDNQARKELYERYAGSLLAVCLRYVGNRDTAQDLLHDGFLKLFSSFDKFTWQGKGSLRAWLERVMVNMALQYPGYGFEKNAGADTHSHNHGDGGHRSVFRRKIVHAW